MLCKKNWEKEDEYNGLINFEVKFMGQEENMELRDKLDNLEEDIQDQQLQFLLSVFPADLEKIKVLKLEK